MKKRIGNWLLSLAVTLPLAFVLLFFGLLPLRFEAVVYTDNIVGEGSCSCYLTDSMTSFSYLYEGIAYFGSELKTLSIPDLRYDVKTIGLYMFGIESVDFISYDVTVFGRTVTHVAKNGVSHPFSRTAKSAVVSEEEPIVHLERTEDEEFLSIGFPGSSLIPVYVWIAYGFLILLSAAVLALVVSVITERFPGLRLHLLGAAALMAAMIMGCNLCGSLPYVNYTDFLLNWLLLFAAALLVNSLTLPWLGTVLVSALTLLWYIANHFVIQFRDKPIMPADLKAFRTAKEVAGNYDFRMTWQIAAGAAVVLCFLALVLLVSRKTKPKEKPPLKKRLIRRGVGAAAAVALLFLGVHNPAFDRLNSFQWDMRVLEGFHREGIVLTFVKSALIGRVQKPENYSRELVADYLKEYRAETGEGVHPTKIIMVMNEAFSDLRTVGLDERIDVMPFIDSLEENTVKGDLYVSIFGGGTCNTEFEALTGNSLAFLGVGAYPYTANVTAPLFSLASYFKELGYSTDAFHANKASNWNRNQVYPHLGFERFRSITDLEAFAPVIYLHDLPTDIGDYRYVESVAAGYGNAPAFLFNVTMQNHSGYMTFVDVVEDATVKEFGSELEQDARVYLSLIKASDDAVRELVEHYRDCDEPTMIVFFGDHQPGLLNKTQNEIYTEAGKYLDWYKTRFFIWTNYPTETEMDVAVSANYLPYLILERGNFPLPPYVQLLREVYEAYPIISAMGVVDAEGNVYASVNELPDDPLLHKYRCVQYANMFDEIDPAWFRAE